MAYLRVCGLDRATTDSKAAYKGIRGFALDPMHQTLRGPQGEASPQRGGRAKRYFEDAAGVQALAENLIRKRDVVPALVRCDFLYLSGLAKVFMNDKRGADAVFDELLELDCGIESGWFGKLVSCLTFSDVGGAEVILTELQLRDAVLWKAGQGLLRSGCSRLGDVAKAMFDVGALLKS